MFDRLCSGFQLPVFDHPFRYPIIGKLRYSTYTLEAIQTCAWTEDMEAVQPLGPFYKEVFTAEEAH